jgi:hypothetical protein
VSAFDLSLVKKIQDCLTTLKNASDTALSLKNRCFTGELAALLKGQCCKQEELSFHVIPRRLKEI